jgi:chorismate synthase
MDSTRYEELRWTPRPGHADYTAEKRYGGHQDYRGGGRFSGRITAGYVMAGALAKQVLAATHGIEVLGYTSQVGLTAAPDVPLDRVRENTERNLVRCPDPDAAREMERNILKARDEGDSLGGAMRCIVLNVPPGVGQPVFDTLEGDLAKALFGVPAVKAVEFGAGTALASMRGSESNDPYKVVGGRVETASNNMGGVLGGVSTGAPIEFTVTFKPTPSVSRPQKTVNLKTLKETTITIEGRHDPCIVPRAVPVVESVAAMVILDQMMQRGHVRQVLGE